MEDRRKDVADKTKDDIKKDILFAKKSGTNYLEFVGGEPTVRKDFLEIIAFANKVGFDTIMFATNGRMLSNKDFVMRIIDNGVNSIVLSIHGNTSALHDSLTLVPGNFDQLMKGLQNLKEIGFDNIGSNTTIVKQNYKFLPEIGEFIYNLGIRNSEFIFVDPTHGAPKNKFSDMVPTYEEVSPYVNKLLSFGKKKDVKHWHIRYYPFCFIDEENHDRVSEKYEKEIFHTEHIAPDFVNENVTKSRKNMGRAYVEKCDVCKHIDICEGYWKEYIKQMGIK